MKLKDVIKKDFENKLDVNFSFDTTQLDDNPKKFDFNKFFKWLTLSIVCVLIAIPLISFIYAGLQINESVKMINRNYSKNELRLVEESSFKPLNNVDRNNSNEIFPVSEEYKYCINEFSNKIYSLLEDDNLSFSPLSLYTTIELLSLIGDSNIKTSINSLFNLHEETRYTSLKNMLKTNYMSNENGSLRMASSLFIDNKEDINMDLINDLTNYFVECFSLSFQNKNDVNKIVLWANNQMNENNYLSYGDLMIDDLTSFILINTLFFDNKWSFMYKDSSNGIFYNDNKEEKNIEFMNHTYFNEYFYDYEDYISFYDYYKNGFKIKYICSKNGNNLFDMIDYKNVFFDQEVNKKECKTIDLTMPIFSQNSNLDFTSYLKKLNLDCLLNTSGFNNIYTSEDNNVNLTYLKQKNEISFSKDGTKIKTVTFGLAGNSQPSQPIVTLEVKLNRPFIYVIYDNNDLPLYVGNVNSL